VNLLYLLEKELAIFIQKLCKKVEAGYLFKRVTVLNPQLLLFLSNLGLPPYSHQCFEGIY
jgi:hypothetical protein